MPRSLATLPGALAFALLCREANGAAYAALARSDAETLHDFRVALRRLRVVVSRYGRDEAVQQRLVRRLKKLTRFTNNDRDCEVMLAWLEEQWPHLGVGEHYGAVQWRQHLHLKIGRDRAHRLELRLARVAKLLPELTASDSAASGSFGRAAAECLQRDRMKLLALLGGGCTPQQLHAARLLCKRLRYLLWPFREGQQVYRNAEALLQQLQQLLGEWHDSTICKQNLFGMLRDEMGSLHGKVARALEQEGPVAVDRCLPALPGLLKLYQRSLQRYHQHQVAIRSYREGAAVTELDNALYQAAATLQKEGAA